LIDLPANSLSAVLNGKKEMPEKWVEKISAYLDSQIPETIKVATKMVVNETGSLALRPSDEKMKSLQSTMDKINKDYG
ncbi:hypothetical protein, partial [Streptococcus pneumoniae]|uniref:hypothetical protein n=1 Tax=Streptococcus pneumoniae TaxID=1313 RepID=UPI0018B07001